MELEAFQPRRVSQDSLPVHRQVQLPWNKRPQQACFLLVISSSVRSVCAIRAAFLESGA